MSRFVRMFRVVEYDKEEDPMLQEVASVENQGSNATLAIGNWLEEEAAREFRAVKARKKGKQNQDASKVVEEVTTRSGSKKEWATPSKTSRRPGKRAGGSCECLHLRAN